MKKQFPRKKPEHFKWIFPLAIGSIVSLFLHFLTTLTSPDGTPLLPFYRSFSISSSVFIESKLHPLPISYLPPPLRFAYFISGSNGDGDQLKRMLQALHHPNNQYIVHLDLESPPEERLDLQNYVNTHSFFVRFGNVKIKKAYLVTYRGPTMVANMLYAAAVLLKEGGDWDWFINLSASDYPLVSQDGKSNGFSIWAVDSRNSQKESPICGLARFSDGSSPPGFVGSYFGMVVVKN